MARPEVSGKRFLMVGRLTEKKAPFVSILAFAKVVATYQDATLDVIGCGNLEDACIQLCEALGVKDNVVFHGSRSHAEVLDMMSQSRCFIQHSVCAPGGDREGTPVGVLEAMGMGLAVVATRHGGILDVIESGKNGQLVDEYDLKGMAEAMLMYAGDADKANSDGQKARAEVMRDWTSVKSIKRLWDIIKSTIKVD